MTKWGAATVSGRVGQVHADIMEAICQCAIDGRTGPEKGQFQLLVDPYKMRICVGGGIAYPKNTLMRLLNELMAVSFSLQIPSRNLNIQGGILEKLELSPSTRNNPLEKEKPRNLWRVTLSQAFVSLLKDDIPLSYDPAPIAKIQFGVAQAIARHILSHRDQPSGGWYIDTLIGLVGADGNSTTMRNRRREVRSCADSLRVVGLLVDGDRIKCVPAVAS